MSKELPFIDKRFQGLEELVYIDIDRPFFIKPKTHPIFYRLSASKTGFHIAFKRDWLTDSEFFLLLIQCDHSWLCKCVVDKRFRIAKNKNGKEATEWRLTHQVTEFGKLQSHTKKILTLLNKYPKLNVATVHYDEILEKLTKKPKKKSVQRTLMNDGDRDRLNRIKEEYAFRNRKG